MSEPYNHNPKITLEISDDEVDLGIPKRKPIGWNYQSVYSPSSNGEQQNGDQPPRKPTLRNNSSDDIEVLEVLEVKKNPLIKIKNEIVFPSTRREIREILRNAKQSSIKKFLQSKNPQEKEEKPTTSGKELPSHDETRLKYSESSGHNGSLVSSPHEDGPEEITSEYSKSIVKKFIERWESLQHFSEDDKKIRDRIWKNYYACHTSYTHSRKFVNGFKKGTEKLTKENLYVFIKEVIENLKLYKDSPYLEKKKKLVEGEEQPVDGQEVVDEAELKRRRKMEKIDKARVKLSKEIVKYERAEVDFDDEVNSSYLILERLKSKFVKLDELYCKYANCSTSTGRPGEKKFRYEGSRYPEINKRITAWVNKNRCFPEYMDVLDLVKNVTKRNDLPLRPETVRVQAQEIFRDVGKILKDRRERDDLFSIYAYACEDTSQDPADDNVELQQALRENAKNARNKLDEVFQYYVDKDNDVKVKEEKNASKGKERLEKETENDEKGKERETEGNEKDFVNGSEKDEEFLQDGEEKESLKEGNEEEETETETEDNSEYLKESNEMLPPLERGDEELSERDENTDVDFDDFDDDIQEIKEIMKPTLRSLGEEYEEEDDDDDDGDEDDYFTDEDVEIAASPPVPLIDENKNGFDDMTLPSFDFTHFKRKLEPEEYAVLQKKKRRDVWEEPEVVEID